MKTREVVIVGKDKECCHGLGLLFESASEFSVAGVFDSYDFEMKHCQKGVFTLLIMDIQNEADCLKKVSELKELPHPPEILVHKSDYNVDLVFSLLNLGVSGYLLRTGHPFEFIFASEEIARGGAYLSPQVARGLINSMKRSGNSPLSQREEQVLKLLAKGKSYSKIAEALFISRTTAKTHIRNIYSKLNVNSKDDAIAKAASDKIIFSINLL